LSKLTKAFLNLKLKKYQNSGDDLLSRYAVSSALRGLTSVFGMGTGVALLLVSPEFWHFFMLGLLSTTVILIDIPAIDNSPVIKSEATKYKL
jgi:hypothetical protein